MENIMTNAEEVLLEEVTVNDAVEVVGKGNFGKNALIVVGVGAVAVLAYKVGKKALAKRKAKHGTEVEMDPNDTMEDVIDVDKD